MSIDETLTALKARVYDKKPGFVASELRISDDTLRRILSDTPPGWVETVRRMEDLVRPAP